MNSVGELNPTSSSVVGLGASSSVGSVYDPVRLETTFGTTPVSDLTFSYTRSDGRTVNAPVTYVNTGLANTLVLQVDPTDGKARIVNDSVFNNVQFDGYQVTSASNSLLDDLEQSPGSIGHRLGGGLTDHGLSGGAEPDGDDECQRRTNGGHDDRPLQDSREGRRTYSSRFRVATVPGDYNANGTVDAADYTVWRNTLGQIVEQSRRWRRRRQKRQRSTPPTMPFGRRTMAESMAPLSRHWRHSDRRRALPVVLWLRVGVGGCGLVRRFLSRPRSSSSAILIFGLAGIRYRFNFLADRQLCLVPVS